MPPVAAGTRARHAHAPRRPRPSRSMPTMSPRQHARSLATPLTCGRANQRTSAASAAQGIQRRWRRRSAQRARRDSSAPSAASSIELHVKPSQPAPPSGAPITARVNGLRAAASGAVDRAGFFGQGPVNDAARARRFEPLRLTRVQRVGPQHDSAARAAADRCDARRAARPAVTRSMADDTPACVAEGGSGYTSQARHAARRFGPGAPVQQPGPAQQ
jgi:hypothetical protein